MRLTQLSLAIAIAAPPGCTAPPDADETPHDVAFRVQGQPDPARLAQSNLGIVINSYGRLPASVTEWRDAIAMTPRTRANDFVVPFSLAPGETHLAKPRILMNAQQRSRAAMKFLPTGRNGNTGASGLYLGFIHHQDATEVEFISYNRQHQAFDFGVIRNMGLPQASVEFVPDATCTSCHIAHAPLFPDNAWSNTAANAGVFRAMVKRLAETNDSFAPLEAEVALVLGDNPDNPRLALAANFLVQLAQLAGSKLLPRVFGFNNDSPLFDFDVNGVRNEREYLRVHQYLAQLPKKEVRDAVVETMIKRYFRRNVGGPFEVGLQTLIAEFAATDLKADHCGLLPSQLPTLLRDFNPVTDSEGTSVAQAEMEPEAVTAILAYDAARRAGTAVVPANRRPSSLAAYAGIVNGVDVAALIDGTDVFDPLHAIGMTSQDAQFMLEPYRLFLLHGIHLGPALTQAVLAAALFNTPGPDSPYASVGALASPGVQALYGRGKLPPREELMSAVFAGLDDFFHAEYGFAISVSPAAYVHPGITPIDLAHEPPNPHKPPCEVGVAQSPCSRCHFQGAQKAPLFDAWNRGIWSGKLAAQPLADADGKLLIKSIVQLQDKSMPTPDTPEAEGLTKEDRQAMVDFLCGELAELKPVAPRYQEAWDERCAPDPPKGDEGEGVGGDPCCEDPSDPCGWIGDLVCDQGCAWGEDPDCSDASSTGSDDAGGSTSQGGSTSSGGESSSGGSTSSGGEGSSGGSSSGGSSTGSTSGGESSGGTSSSGGESSGGMSSSGGESSGGMSSSGGESSGDSTSTSDTGGSSTGTSSTGTSGSDAGSSTDTDGDTGGDDDGLCGSYCDPEAIDCADQCCVAPQECDESEYLLCLGMCEWCSVFVCEYDDELDDTTGGDDSTTTTGEDTTTTGDADSTTSDSTSSTTAAELDPKPVPKKPLPLELWPGLL